MMGCFYKEISHEIHGEHEMVLLVLGFFVIFISFVGKYFTNNLKME